MLGKLLKHEFKMTYKNFLLMFALLVCTSVLAKLFILVKIDTPWYSIIMKLINALYVIFVVAVSFVSVVMVIAQMNKTLLKDEGYLFHTLPVKTWQHIVVKGITGTVWYLATLVVMCGSIAIYFIGDEDFWEIVRSAFKSLEHYYSQSGWLVLVSIIFVINLIVQVVVNMNSFMAALSLGQIFAKHRIAGAVLFWVVMNYAVGMVTSLAQFVLMPVLKKMEDYSFSQAKTPILIFLLGVLVFNIIVGGIYFFIANYMMSKKLNLE